MNRNLNYLKSLRFIITFIEDKKYAESRVASAESNNEEVPSFSKTLDWSIEEWADKAEDCCDQYFADTDAFLVAELIYRCIQNDSTDMTKYIRDIKADLSGEDFKFSYGKPGKTYEALEV